MKHGETLNTMKKKINKGHSLADLHLLRIHAYIQIGGALCVVFIVL